MPSCLLRDMVHGTPCLSLTRRTDRSDRSRSTVDQIDHDLDQIDQIDHDLDQIDQIDQIDHDLDQIHHDLDQIDQIDDDLDHLVPALLLCDVVQDLYSTDPTRESRPRSCRLIYGFNVVT